MGRWRWTSVTILATLDLVSTEARAVEIAASWTPLVTQLSAPNHSYRFYSLLGAGVHVRYALISRLVVEAGYELQTSGASTIFHGPELNLEYTFWGGRSYRFTDEPLAFALDYPFEAHFSFGPWIREHDFSSFFPADASSFEETALITRKGSVLGIQAALGLGTDVSENLHLFFRVRGASGFTPDITDGRLLAYGLQAGLMLRL